MIDAPMKRFPLIFVMLGMAVMVPSLLTFPPNGSQEFASGLFIGSLIILVGILNAVCAGKGIHVTFSVVGKSRATAHDTSIIPGIGHIYLGKMKVGSAMFGLFLFSVFLLFQSVATGPYDAGALFVYAVSLMAFSVLWSLIRICETCDDRDLPFKVGLLMNYYVSNVLKYERILLICTYFWLTLVILMFASLGYVTDLQLIWVGSVAPITFLAYGLMRKHDGEKTFVRLKI